VLTVHHADDPAYRDLKIRLETPFIPNEISGAPLTAARIAALHVLSFYPVPFLAVAAIVLAQCFHDRHAWLLAVLCASLIARSRPLELEPIIHPLLRKPLIAYCVLWGMVLPGAFCYFFAGFPEPTPLDRRMPWLKVLLIALPLLSGAFLAAAPSSVRKHRPTFGRAV
jgi:hypothetical protein